jgi:hypothetical protein
MTRKSPPYIRVPWEDRFNRPAVKQLRDGLPARVRPIFDRCRRSLLSLSDVSETLAWYGESWRWAIEYRTKHSDEPLCVVIPSPGDLQLAVPLERDFLNSLSLTRMKRAVRDGLQLAREPFDTHWGIWTLPGTSLVDDLQGLVESKLRHLGKVAG